MDFPDWAGVELLSWPTDWTVVFGREAPLWVEIGFGSGQYLARMAHEHPQMNYIGIEVSLPSMRSAARKMYNNNLENVRLLQADAKDALWSLFLPETIERVIINFPDPWPKKSHHSRRLISKQMLHLLATRMRPDAALNISTDHEEYAAAITEHLSDTPYFESRLFSASVRSVSERVYTKYEQFALDSGHECTYFRWKRNETMADDLFPIPKELSMPHVVLRAPATLTEIGRLINNQAMTAGDIVVRYLECYESMQGNNLLVETYVKEEPLTQRVCLSVRQRSSGEWVVGLHDIGFPRPTAGIHLAIRGLTELIQDTFPATIIVTENLQGGMSLRPK